MKKVTLTSLLLFVFNLVLQAQTLIYNENFTGTSNLSALSSSWVISTASPNTTVNASGDRYLTTSNSVTNNTTLLLQNLNTTGYTNLTISWNGKKANNTANMVLAYSLDGVNFTSVPNFTDVVANGSWAAINNGAAITLPDQTADASQLTLRWTVTVSNSRNYSIDDIVISGTPIDGTSTLSWAGRANNEDPFVVSSPTATNPYSKDGVTLRMTKQSATGVNLTTALLSDATFQNPARTLTLIQSGSTAAIGTVITTNFSAAVNDLTFTMFDVDRTAGQFRDIIKIEGYLNGTLVSLQKKDVITTSLNEFVEGTNTIQALATGVDAAATTNNGNVTVKFSSPVNRLVLTYNNLDGSAGNQGIAINSFSWRMTLNPLPVTLTAFNGNLVNKQTELKWATASEKNNEKFVIEKSLDGRSFEVIGSVKGNGSTSQARQYNFTDARPAQGTNYYRLKQVDFNGSFEYSKIVTVKNGAVASSELTIYPVPATSQITVSVKGNNALENLKIYNLAGNVVKEISLTVENNLEVNVPVNDLPAGYYVVKVSGPATTLTRKIVKQ